MSCKNIKNLVGQKFGRLTVLSITNKRNGSNVVWLCRCDCGNLTMVNSGNLGCGGVKSCGCLRKKGSGLKHGDAKKGRISGLWRSWSNMKGRCLNPNHRAYKNYGGRGIQVCTRWLNDYFIFKKWAMSNGYIPKLSIDRIDNDGNYEPDNCQWITRSENARKRWKSI